MKDTGGLPGRSWSSPDRGTLSLLATIGRPHFVLAGFFLFLLGALFALCTGIPFNPGRFLWGYALVACAHMSVSYTNEYYDRHADDPDARSPVSGGSGILPVRPELAGQVRMLAVLLSVASLLLAAGFVVYFSWTILLIPFVLAALFLSWGYSAPPFRFCSRGIGELATLIAFGFFLPGSGYLVMAGTIDRGFLLFSVPLLFLGLFFILSVELPDREVDLRSGKRNMVTKFARGKTRLAIAGAGVVVLIIYLVFWLGHLLYPCPAGGFVLASLFPLAAGTTGLLRSSDEREGICREAARNIGSLTAFAVCSCIILAVLGVSA